MEPLECGSADEEPGTTCLEGFRCEEDGAQGGLELRVCGVEWN